MNGLRRPVLRFRRTRRACTDQSQPTFCPGADIPAHNAPVCSCCLWRRQLLHSHLAPAQIDFVVGVPAARKYSAQIETVDLGQLVASTSPAPRSAARESSAATKTIAIATGFLLARFVDLKLTAFDIQTVKFSNGSCRVISRPEFDESKTA